MMISKRRARQTWLSLALWPMVVASAAADPPAQAESSASPKPVRQVGGAQGTQVQAKPGPGPAAQTPAARAELRERMKAAHEAMLRAREQVRANMVEGRSDPTAMQRAREDAREAMEEATLQLHAAREQRQVESDQGSAADRADRAKRSRHTAWRGLALRVKRPSEIPAELRSEYRQHARRMARLQRIRRLALVKRDQPVLDRVANLTAREQERHHQQLAAYFAEHPPVRPAAAPGVRADAPAEENDTEMQAEELEERENEERGEP